MSRTTVTGTDPSFAVPEADPAVPARPTPELIGHFARPARHRLIGPAGILVLSAALWLAFFRMLA